MQFVHALGIRFPNLTYSEVDVRPPVFLNCEGGGLLLSCLHLKLLLPGLKTVLNRLREFTHTHNLLFDSILSGLIHSQSYLCKWISLHVLDSAALDGSIILLLLFLLLARTCDHTSNSASLPGKSRNLGPIVCLILVMVARWL